MTKVCWIGTRKGLLKVQQSEAGIWSLSAPDFTGEPVTMVLPQNGSGSMYVALNLGHFGPKLHRSDDAGISWQECTAPGFPKLKSASDAAKSVKIIWILEYGADHELWAGTVPAGLFRSKDRGDSWQSLAVNLAAIYCVKFGQLQPV